MSHGQRTSKRKGRRKAVTVLGVAGAFLAGGASGAAVGPPSDTLTANTTVTLYEEEIPALVCRLSTSLTTKTLEHVVPAYNLPRGRAVGRGKVAEAAQ